MGWTYLAVALGSAVGGTARWVASEALAGGAGFPWGTLFVNATGSWLIGLYAALTVPGGRIAAGPLQRHFVMTGICGGYTTFSVFSLETVRFLEDGRLGLAGLNIGCRPVRVCAGRMVQPARCPAGRKVNPRRVPESRPGSLCRRVAEGMGFEPTIPLITVYPLSRRAPSTTRPPLPAQERHINHEDAPVQGCSCRERTCAHRCPQACSVCANRRRTAA
jgi:CrcB protein